MFTLHFITQKFKFFKVRIITSAVKNTFEVDAFAKLSVGVHPKAKNMSSSLRDKKV